MVLWDFFQMAVLARCTRSLAPVLVFVAISSHIQAQGLPKPEGESWGERVEATPGIAIIGNPDLDSYLWTALASGLSERDELAERSFDFAQLMVRALGGSGASEIEDGLRATGIECRQGYGKLLAGQIVRFPTNRWVKLQPEECRLDIRDTLPETHPEPGMPNELEEAGIDQNSPVRVAAVRLGGVAQNGLTVTRTHYIVERPGRPARLLSVFSTDKIAFRPGDTPPEVARMKRALGPEQPARIVDVGQLTQSLQEKSGGGVGIADRLIILGVGVGVLACAALLLIPRIRAKRRAP